MKFFDYKLYTNISNNKIKEPKIKINSLKIKLRLNILYQDLF